MCVLHCFILLRLVLHLAIFREFLTIAFNILLPYLIAALANSYFPFYGFILCSEYLRCVRSSGIVCTTSHCPALILFPCHGDPLSIGRNASYHHCDLAFISCFQWKSNQQLSSYNTNFAFLPGSLRFLALPSFLCRHTPKHSLCTSTFLLFFPFFACVFFYLSILFFVTSF